MPLYASCNVLGLIRSLRWQIATIVFFSNLARRRIFICGSRDAQLDLRSNFTWKTVRLFSLCFDRRYVILFWLCSPHNGRSKANRKLSEGLLVSPRRFIILIFRCLLGVPSNFVFRSNVWFFAYVPSCEGNVYPGSSFFSISVANTAHVRM